MLCLWYHSLLCLSFLVDPIEAAFSLSKSANRWMQGGKMDVLANLTCLRFCLYDGEVWRERIPLRLDIGRNLLWEKIKSGYFLVCHLDIKGHFLIITIP